jgi:hypothetical protein
MKAQLIVFAVAVSLDTNQEVREREKVRKSSYSIELMIGVQRKTKKKLM